MRATRVQSDWPEQGPMRAILLLIGFRYMGTRRSVINCTCYAMQIRPIKIQQIVNLTLDLLFLGQSVG